jgi:hypothetical protein
LGHFVWFCGFFWVNLPPAATVDYLVFFSDVVF